MKAIQVSTFGGPEVLEYRETRDLVPGPGQVLVEAKAVGVNPVDTYIRAGNYGERPFPFTPGMDAAGVVLAVGEGVTSVAPGDRVYTAGSITGTYAEQILCNASQVHPLSSRLSFSQGASIHVPYFTAWRALLQKAASRTGETLLVHGGSGGVGTAAIQIAKALGIRSVGTAGSEAGKELVRQCGAEAVADHTQPGYLQQAVQDFTDGKGFDIILEMLSNVNLDNDLEAVAFQGRIVIIGCRGRIEIDPRRIMRKEPIVTGMVLMSTPPQEMQAIADGLAEGFENGSLVPLVGKEMPLAEAARAHKEILEPGARGNIVLIP